MRFLINDKNDEVLASINKDADDHTDTIKTRYAFLEKQIDDLKEEKKNAQKRHWERIETRLKDIGVLTDEVYQAEKHVINYSPSGDFFITDKCDHHDIGELFKKFIEQKMT